MKKLERKYYYSAYVTLMILIVPAVASLIMRGSILSYVFLLTLATPLGLIGAFTAKFLAERGITTGQMYNLTAVLTAGAFTVFSVAMGIFFTAFNDFMPALISAPWLIGIIYVTAFYTCCLLIANFTTNKARIGAYIFLVFCCFIAFPFCLESLTGTRFCDSGECIFVLGNFAGASYGWALFFGAFLYIPVFFIALIAGWMIKFILSFFFTEAIPEFVKAS